jgi:hypothetical protein
MKIIIYVLIILFSFSISFAGEKRWIGNTNNKGHITKSKRYRKSTIPKNYPKPKFIPYPNVYWETGDGKKYHLGKYRVK